MRVVVLGGTGRTGRRIVAAGVEAGLQMVSFGRSARADSVPPGAEAHAGDVLQASDVRAALDGADALVTALSIPRVTRSPFSALVGPPDLHSRSTALLLDVLPDCGVRRWVKLSAQGVGDSAPRAGWGFRALVAASNLRPAFTDHAVADAALQQADLDWTIIRPPMLDDGEATGAVVASPDAITWTWTRVRTGDVAAWIIGALDDDTTVRRTLSLVPGRS